MKRIISWQREGERGEERERERDKGEGGIEIQSLWHKVIYKVILPNSANDKNSYSVNHNNNTYNYNHKSNILMIILS